MKIGIFVSSISNFGQKDFYNSQELGLAKALAKKFDAVTVYKLVPLALEKTTQTIDGCNNANIHFIPSKNWGINGICDTKVFNTALNALIHFSDTQFSVPSIYTWCRKNNIKYIPYIGVVESHATNIFKKLITNFLFNRNITVYKKCFCCAKTPTVQRNLMTLGIKRSVVAPVGLDIDLLKNDFEKYSRSQLKRDYGYKDSDKVLLFIGRLIEQKHPVRMVEIFSEIIKCDKTYKLLIVGTGHLRITVDLKIKKLKLENQVRIIDQIPNNDIWKLYRLANVFINLNQQEIFGMAIMEAMYYGCNVIAWEAPGPNYIIVNKENGYLVNSNDQVIRSILDIKNVSEESHNRILEKFTWNSMAEVIKELVEENYG